MKRIALIFILASLGLSACSQQATPTASDSEMMTKVAQVLTNMPTVTPTGGGAKLVTATVGLPTVAPTSAVKTAAPTSSGSAVTPPASSPTSAPVASATVATTAAATVTKLAPSNTPTGPTATAVASDPRFKLGNPTWTDKMNDGGNWPTGADPAGYTEVAFTNGNMELTAFKAIDGWRLSYERFGNAYLEMTVNSGSCKPKDRYGFIARVPSASDANRGYLFGFTCDGKFSIRKWDGSANSMTNFILWKANPAINAGADKTNRLGVMFQGSKMTFYANGVMLGEVADNTWSAGNFGIFAGAHESPNYTIKVDEISFWINQ